jgi:hypothetical protein
LRLRSKPAYNIATGLPSSIEDARSIAPREALLHGIPYHTATGAIHERRNTRAAGKARTNWS